MTRNKEKEGSRQERKWSQKMGNERGGKDFDKRVEEKD